MNIKSTLSIAALAIASVNANATILTFSDMQKLDYGEISQNYGDNVVSLSDAYGSYLKGNAFTPNITVSHASYNASGSQANPALEYWGSNYGDLQGVAFSGVNGSYAQLTLKADTGYFVKLNSFDMAGWSKADRNLTILQVLDASGNELWNSNLTSIKGAGGTHDTFMPNIVGQELTIRWGTDWNIGLDNVNFDQTSEVPLPAAAWMFLTALLGLRAVKK